MTRFCICVRHVELATGAPPIGQRKNRVEIKSLLSGGVLSWRRILKTVAQTLQCEGLAAAPSAHIGIAVRSRRDSAVHPAERPVWQWQFPELTGHSGHIFQSLKSKEVFLWHCLCTASLSGRPLLDKGKPAVRRGRKATGQAESLTAGLPKEGWWSPRGNTVVFLKGDHEHSRRCLSSAASRTQSRGRGTPPGHRPR